MADGHDNGWAAAAASALEWWEAAGVDCLVEETVCDWFAPPPPRGPAAVTAAAPAAEADSDIHLPDTLDAFLAWRFGAGAPERRWNADPLAIEGDPASNLLVLVDHPDSDTGLCDGAPGRLLDAMLAAIGRSRADICLAAIAHARPLADNLQREEVAGLARLARHFAGLSGATRVLILSKQASGAFLETSGTHAPGHLHGINQTGRKLDVVATLHPRFLLERPAHKATAWKDLQSLLGGKRQ
jgi:uracil-DNA glycosylase